VKEGTQYGTFEKGLLSASVQQKVPILILWLHLLFNIWLAFQRFH